MITASRLRGFLEVMKKQFPDEWDWWEQEPASSAASSPFWCAVIYKTSRPPFRFFVEFNEESLFAQYVLPDIRVHADCCLALYGVLLRLNEELALVKFGLTPQGNITFMGELPAAQFSLDTFQSLLRLMVHYLEQLYWEINVVANSPDLARFLTGREMNLAQMDHGFRNLVRTLKTEDIIHISSR